MEKKVSYGFSEALNLVDDWQAALQQLNNEPTSSQIIIDTNIESFDDDQRTDAHSVYFMVRIATNDDKTYETANYILYVDYGRYLDSDTRYDLTQEQYNGAEYSAADLEGIIREVIDNFQVINIYIDSL